MRIILDDPIFTITEDKVMVDVSEYFERAETEKAEPQIFDDTKPKDVVKAAKKEVTKAKKEPKKVVKKAVKSVKIENFADLEKDTKVMVQIIDKDIIGISDNITEFPATVKSITGDILTLIADITIDGDIDTVWDLEPTDLGTVVEIVKL